jgi:hypothetical protein
VLPEQRRSAGRAWILSLLAPGAGQLFCGAKTRGFATLGCFVAGLAVTILVPGNARWIAFRLIVFLYAFAGLDAYLTACEHNRGEEADAADNPRVAAVLNLTTNGFGYVYVGQKLGFVVVILMITVGRMVSATVPLLGEAIVLAMAVHAWTIARRRRGESYPPNARLPAFESSLAAWLPVGLASVVLAGYYGLVTFAQIALILRHFARSG